MRDRILLLYGAAKKRQKTIPTLVEETQIVGQGVFCNVYRARMGDSVVVVKRLRTDVPEHVGSDDASVEKYKTAQKRGMTMEYTVLNANLSRGHKNLIQMMPEESTPEKLVLEHCPHDLFGLMTQADNSMLLGVYGRFPTEAEAALQHLHTVLFTVHCDVTLQNWFLREDGTVVLADFNLSLPNPKHMPEARQKIYVEKIKTRGSKEYHPAWDRIVIPTSSEGDVLDMYGMHMCGLLLAWNQDRTGDKEYIVDVDQTDWWDDLMTHCRQIDQTSPVRAHADYMLGLDEEPVHRSSKDREPPSTVQADRTKVIRKPLTRTQPRGLTEAVEEKDVREWALRLPTTPSS